MYATAAPFYQRALAIEEKSWGAEHPALAPSLLRFARFYRVQGDYEQAERFYRRRLALLDAALGPDHPFTLAAADDSAFFFLVQGKYAEAEPLFKRSLRGLDRMLAPTHPALAPTLDRYAVVLRETGRAGDASDVEARAAKIRARYSGTASAVRPRARGDRARGTTLGRTSDPHTIRLRLSPQ